MNYQTYEPDEILDAYIKCYWTLESMEEVNTERQSIVPDGCIEMIFHYGDLYKQYLEGGRSIIQPRCFVIGQLTRPLEIEPTGKTGIFSLRFLPGGFLPFSTMPLKELENKAVSLDELYGIDGTDLAQSILNAGSTSEKINLAENFLLSRLSDVNIKDSIIKSTIDTLFTANGQLTVDELIQHTKISRRQLERKFSSTIGMSPKKLSKVVRLQATLKVMLTKEFTNLTALAYEGDYYDQAHFIKDFKELTGFTPKEFYGSNVQLSSLFYGKA